MTPGKRHGTKVTAKATSRPRFTRAGALKGSGSLRFWELGSARGELGASWGASWGRAGVDAASELGASWERALGASAGSELGASWEPPPPGSQSPDLKRSGLASF